MENCDHPEIEIENMPTFPAPWLSSDKGEVFTSGDYLMVLQKKPITLIEQMYLMKNKKCPDDVVISYLYALLVFHKIGRENMFRPILAVTLEQSDQAKLLQMLGDDDEYKKMLLENNGLSRPMLCMFMPGKHANFGPYPGKLDRDAVKDALFTKLREFCPIGDSPKKVGNIPEVLSMLQTENMQ